MTSGTTFSPPPAFGRFRLLHQIGAGVLGPVFRTHDPDDDKLVAVKAFAVDLGPEQTAAFVEELRRLVVLELPTDRLAAPIDAGVEDTVAYLAQHYVAGESLDAAIRQYGPAPAADAARLVSHVAEALDTGARLGVFHGALHPRDVLVTPGETHLTGLGVATALERVGLKAPVRRPYAAPEREAGGAWGAAADVFALAAIAHEVLTGRRALPGTEEPLPGLDELKVADVAALRDVLEAALDVDPERRPATAAEFAGAFATALGLGTGAAAGTGGRSRRRAKPKAPPRLPGLEDPLEGADAPPPVVERVAAEPVEPPAPPAPPASGGVRRRRTAPAAFVVEPPAPEPVPEPVVEIADPPVPIPDPEPEVVVAPVPAGEVVDDEPPADVPAEAEPDSLPAPPPAEDAAPDPALPEPTPEEPADRDEPVSDLPGLFGELPPERDAADDIESLRQDLERFSPAPGVTDEPRPADGPAIDVSPEVLAAPSGPRAFDTADLSGAVSVPAVRPRPVRPSERPARHVPEATADDFRELGTLLAEPPVPRALDPGIRPSAASRRVEPYRPLPVPPPRQFGLAGAGLALGLVVGLVLGYWWGSRAAGAPSGPSTEPASPSATVTRPAPTAAPTPLATPGTAKPAQPVTSAPRPTPAAPAPAERPAAAAAKPQVESGRLRVRSTPDRADVFVDGVRRGVTPRDVDRLPFGEHTVRVTRPGYQPQERRVTVDADNRDLRVTFTLQRAGRRATPATPRPPAPKPTKTPAPAAPAAKASTAPAAAQGEPGSIDVETRPPGARVRLDGRDAGVSPIVVGRVTPGRHTVRLELAGHRPWTTTIEVKAGARTRIAASLEPITEEKDARR